MSRFRAFCRRGPIPAICGAAILAASHAQAQTVTGFTYQGVLSENGAPASGNIGATFRLFGQATGGAPLATYTPGGPIAVANGLMTLPLDFGANVFNGTPRWLEIEVNGQILSPRQPITPVPYALKVAGIDGHSLNASDADPVDALFVNGAGRVGIGTTTPEMSLEVTTGSFYGRPAVGVAHGDHYLYLHGSEDHSFIWDDEAALRFGTETSRETGYVERMRITSDGKVGIGTQNPEFPLHCVGNAKLTEGDLFIWGTTSSILSLKSTGAGGSDWRMTSTNANAEGGAGQFWLHSPNIGRALTVQADGDLLLGIGDRIIVQPDGDVGIGTVAPQAKLDVAGETRTHVLRITGGADVAEPFVVNRDEADVVDGSKPEVTPGMVVSIDATSPGELRVSTTAYDRTVAGIISGANGINPGMVLAQEGSIADGKHPVALTGRVYVWCDADASGPIQPGDLLTTSATAGHAMKAADAARAPGATIGKAMTSLNRGQGLVLVLVSLQ